MPLLLALHLRGREYFSVACDDPISPRRNVRCHYLPVLIHLGQRDLEATA